MGAGMPIEGEAALLPKAGGIARTNVPTCNLDTPIDAVRQLLDQSEWDSCFVINEESIVLGRIYRSKLEEGMDGTAQDAMDPGPSTYRPDVPAIELLERMREEDLSNAPITTSDGVLVGLALRDDVEAAAKRSPDITTTEENPAASNSGA
jgi:CBS domain-containing protein